MFKKLSEHIQHCKPKEIHANINNNQTTENYRKKILKVARNYILSVEEKQFNSNENRNLIRNQRSEGSHTTFCKC